MAGASRNDRVLAAIRRVLDHDEEVVERDRCWAAVRRPHVPLLLLSRHQYEAFLTDRRLILIRRHRRALQPTDVVLVKRFEAMTLVEEHQRVLLLQQRIHTDTGTSIVVEWPRRSRRLGWALSSELPRPVHWAAS
jgi:hypothetical protein